MILNHTFIGANAVPGGPRVPSADLTVKKNEPSQIRLFYFNRMLIFQAVQSFESNKNTLKSENKCFFFLLLGHDGNKNQNKHMNFKLNVNRRRNI